ncbi:MAG TPA: GNAT family N-acyltransferase [Vicinamibacterales bacterium]
MAVEIIDASSPALREDVFRFRYDIYVREMGRAQKDADHARGRIEDRLDAFAVLLAARDSVTGAIAGTVRSNVLSDGDIGAYARLYGLEGLSPAERRATAMTTRLMVERGRRGTMLAVKLAVSLFARGLERSVDEDYIDCNEHLVPFFHGLGYRRLRAIDHPEYGRVTLMRLDMRDVAYFRQIGSPFAGVHARRERVA